MSDHPPGSQYYYSCADIRIVAAATSTTIVTSPGGSTTTTAAPPTGCDGLASYERATCLIADATSLPMCGSDSLDAHLGQRLAITLAAIQHLLDEAVAPATPDRRTRHDLATSRRRLAKLRRRIVAAGNAHRVSVSCAQTIVTRLDDLRAAIEPLAE
jgi:hypothetical protein